MPPRRPRRRARRRRRAGRARGDAGRAGRRADGRAASSPSTAPRSPSATSGRTRSRRCRARPSLVLWGRDDPYVPPEIGERHGGRASTRELHRVRRLRPLVAVGARRASPPPRSSGSGRRRAEPAPAPRPALLAGRLVLVRDLARRCAGPARRTRCRRRGHRARGTHRRTRPSCTPTRARSSRGPSRCRRAGPCAPPRAVHSLVASCVSAPTTTPPFMQRPPLKLCWCQRSFGPGEALGRAVRVEHQVAEPDDLGVGRRCRRRAARTVRAGSNSRRARCSCSARRCTARTRVDLW